MNLFGRKKSTQKETVEETLDYVPYPDRFFDHPEPEINTLARSMLHQPQVTGELDDVTSAFQFIDRCIRRKDNPSLTTALTLYVETHYVDPEGPLIPCLSDLDRCKVKLNAQYAVPEQVVQPGKEEPLLLYRHQLCEWPVGRGIYSNPQYMDLCRGLMGISPILEQVRPVEVLGRPYLLEYHPEWVDYTANVDYRDVRHDIYSFPRHRLVAKLGLTPLEDTAAIVASQQGAMTRVEGKLVYCLEGKHHTLPDLDTEEYLYAGMVNRGLFYVITRHPDGGLIISFLPVFYPDTDSGDSIAQYGRWVPHNIHLDQVRINTISAVMTNHRTIVVLFHATESSDTAFLGNFQMVVRLDLDHCGLGVEAQYAQTAPIGESVPVAVSQDLEKVYTLTELNQITVIQQHYHWTS